MVVTRRISCIEVVLAAWSFAEATWFFVVPDVCLSWLATRRDTRWSDCVRLLVLATAAAVLGGLVVRETSRAFPDRTRAAMVSVPAVSAGMVRDVEQRVEREGFCTVVTASSRGEPYKLYAAAAGDADESLSAFICWTVLGRLLRFAIACGIGFLVGRVVSSYRIATGIWAAVWAAIYGAYWWRFPLWP